MFRLFRVFRPRVDGDALPRDGADRVRVVRDDVADANLKFQFLVYNIRSLTSIPN